MAFSMHDLMRWFSGGDRKEKSVFKTEKEAYDFCRNAYTKQGGIPPELRKSYEFYLKNYDDGCERELRPVATQNR